jgi:Holliday junction DNA helicase RuvA
MYTYFEGRLVEKNPAYAVIDCNGVGYMLNISLNTYTQLPDNGTKCKLFAHLSVKEDAHILYGFKGEDERHMFRNLISVSGVGEVTARMMLSSLTPPEIQQAIVNGDVVKLKSVKGIGEKSAQRIIIDLRNKMGKESFGSAPIIASPHNKLKLEALNALEVLGYARNIAEKAIDNTIREGGDSLSLEELVKRILKNF